MPIWGTPSQPANQGWRNWLARQASLNLSSRLIYGCGLSARSQQNPMKIFHRPLSSVSLRHEDGPGAISALGIVVWWFLGWLFFVEMLAPKVAEARLPLYQTSSRYLPTLSVLVFPLRRTDALYPSVGDASSSPPERLIAYEYGI